MPEIKKKWQGRSSYRYKDNPLEREFALAWQAENDRTMGGSPLDYLVQTKEEIVQMLPGPALKEERLLSCTFIQWLGSPVGQCFLEKVLRTKAGRVFLGHRLGLPSCPGIEVKPGRYSGCGGGNDCPTCHGQWWDDRRKKR